MDFTHANMRAPWGFVRDTDSVWNLKVLAEEKNFPEWQIRDRDFTDDRFFSRLKEWGFESREELSTFLARLSDTVTMTGYDKAEMAALLSVAGTPIGDELSVEDLERLGLDWMRDVAHFATLSHWTDTQDDDRTAFDLEVRRFRHEHDWVTTDFTGEDELDYVYPTDGTVLYYGYRTDSETGEELLFVGTMEGVAETVTPSRLVDVDENGWDVALASPGLTVEDPGETVTLADSQAVLFSRSPESDP